MAFIATGSAMTAVMVVGFVMVLEIVKVMVFGGVTPAQSSVKSLKSPLEPVTVTACGLATTAGVSPGPESVQLTFTPVVVQARLVCVPDGPLAGVAVKKSIEAVTG